MSELGKLSDLQAAELISRSLSQELTAEEDAKLQHHLQELPPDQAEMAKSYASLSAWIDRSANWEEGDLDSENQSGLSAVSKERMRRSIRRAKAEAEAEGISQTLDRTAYEAQRVADQGEMYRTAESGGERNTAGGQGQLQAPEECRQAVSRFTLLKKIGQGGLGTVWLARDELLRRNVALKELNPEAAASRRQWERFRREAEVTGHLEHPNVVPLYMSGVNPETGRPFYAMRFLGKTTLAEAIQEYHAKVAAGVAESIDLHRLLNSFLQVCQALAYAHSRGVIHRDLKPDNVILDNFGQVIVLDWGLAKIESQGELAVRLAMQGERSDLDLSQTLDGDVVGTPLYMAPEQAAGDLEKIDRRTDVYGLGAILFAILTGAAPHQRSNISRDGKLRVKDFLDSIVSSATPSPRAVNAMVPKDLEAICMRAMAKEKYARYSDVNFLADEVERWIAGKNEKESRYDSMRMTGHELKSRLCVQLRQLAAVALFMVELPPIQGLVHAMRQESAAEEYAVWRERLSQILLALIKTKPNMSGTCYVRVAEDRARELVRVERSLHDVSNLRSVPQSRLVDAIANAFQSSVTEQLPGECAVSFDCSARGTVRVLCGVPVFDNHEEVPFGLVVAEAEIGNLVRPELQLSDSQDTVYLFDDEGSVLFTSANEAGIKSRHAGELFPKWDEIKSTLRHESEYLDSDREVFATRLKLPSNSDSIHILFHLHRA